VAGYTSDPLGYQVLVADGTSFVILPQDVERPTDENVGWQDVFGRFAEGTRLLLLPITPGESGASRRALLTPDALAWDGLLVLSVLAGAPLLLSLWERARTGLRPAAVPSLKPATRSAEGGSASGAVR
jgi:hypothetical protein